MVVGVLEPRLQSVVVYIRHAEFGFHLVYTHTLELQISHSASGVLRESLVYLYAYLASRFHLAAYEMRFDYFSSYVQRTAPPKVFSLYCTRFGAFCQ